MKIGILNFGFECTNYGALLTSYALNAFLNRHGFDAFNINYIPAFARNFPAGAGPLTDVSNFRKFRAAHIRQTREFSTIASLFQTNRDFDIFISGSDQVFNYPVFTRHESDYLAYLLGFTAPGKCRLSYAASFGEAVCGADDFHRQIMGLLLSRFQFLSTREESGIDILKNEFSLPAVLAADPVFLLGQEEWSRLAAPDHAKEQAGAVAYIINPATQALWGEGLNGAVNIGRFAVEKWLSAFRDAECVITDSFHGVCFSLLFQKRFFCAISCHQRVERIRHLFEKFQLPPALLFVFDPEKTSSLHLPPDLPAPDYATLSPAIQAWAEESRAWLLGSLRSWKRHDAPREREEKEREAALLLLSRLDGLADSLAGQILLAQSRLDALSGRLSTLERQVGRLKEVAQLARAVLKAGVSGSLTVATLGLSRRWRHAFITSLKDAARLSRNL